MKFRHAPPTLYDWFSISQKFSPRNSHFLLIRESFLPQIFPTVCYLFFNVYFCPSLEENVLSQEYFFNHSSKKTSNLWNSTTLIESIFLSGLEWKWLWSSSEEAEDHTPWPTHTSTSGGRAKLTPNLAPLPLLETSRHREKRNWVMSLYTHNTNKVKQTNKEWVNIRSTSCGWMIVFCHVG